jgi:FkbM family methyltransferase
LPYDIHGMPAWASEVGAGQKSQKLLFFTKKTWRFDSGGSRYYSKRQSRQRRFTQSTRWFKKQIRNTIDGKRERVFRPIVVEELAEYHPEIIRAKLPHDDRLIDIFKSDKSYLLDKEHNVQGTCYRLQTLGLTSEDVFLDIGAHVGVVSLAALRYNVSKVVAVEPAYWTYKCLARNLEDFTANGRAIILNKALTHEGARYVALHISKTRQYFNSAYSGRKNASLEQPQYAAPVNMRELVREFQPTVIKIDCEGSENFVVDAMDEPAWANVRIIIGEYDFKHQPATDAYFKFRQAIDRNFNVKIQKVPGISRETSTWVFFGQGNKCTGRYFKAVRKPTQSAACS